MSVFPDGGSTAPAIGHILSPLLERSKSFETDSCACAKPFRIALSADGNMWFSDANN